MKKITSSVIAIVLLQASTLSAQFLIYDGFETPGDYTADTNISAQTGAGSGNWGGSSYTYDNEGQPVNTVTSSLTYTDGSNTLATADGSIQKTAGVNSVFSRTFDNTAFNASFGAGEDIWLSTLIGMEATTDITFRVSRADQFNGAGFDIIGGTLVAKFNNSTSSGSMSMTPGQTYFLVGRIQQDAGAGGDDVFDLWVNPDLGSTPVGSGDLTVEQGYAISLMGRVVMQSRNNDSIHMDEIRVGASFDAVAPTIPEPSVYALAFGLCAGVLVCFRRRR